MSKQKKEKKNVNSKDEAFTSTVKHQKFVVLTLVTPECFSPELKEENKDTYIFKVRGVFDTIDGATERANFFKKSDRRSPTFVVELGKWCSIEIDYDYTKELTMSREDLINNYSRREKALNLLMRDFKRSLRDLSLEQKKRKDDDLKNSKVVTGKVNIDPEKGPIGNIENLNENTENINEDKNSDEDILNAFNNFVDSDNFDYLDEDKPFRKLIKHQNYCVVSMLTPHTFPESKYEEVKNKKIWGIKIRGIFETFEDAQERSDHLQKVDKFNNVFCHDVGEFLPLDVDMTAIETEKPTVYRESQLNTYLNTSNECIDEDNEESTVLANKSEIDTRKLVIDEDNNDENNNEDNTNKDETEQENTQENTKNNKFANQMSTEEKIKNTKKERDDLLNQVAENTTNLDSFQNKLNELSAMFKALNK